MQTNDYYYMSLALQLAEYGRYSVSPNPMVGCVIVKNNIVVGQGFHERAGCAHAEINALSQAGENAKDATVYVTLEPCCHHGRTPPCSAALIAARVKKIIIACQDPNPLVSNKGIQQLQAAGIEVIVGVGEKEALQLNEIFFHYIKTQRPFVIAKWAMSLDGKTITHTSDSRIISDKQSQHHAHQLRKACDAILIGSATAIGDDPQLTVRENNSLAEKQPLRIILSSQANLPLSLKLLNGSLPGKTLIATTVDVNPFTNQQNVGFLKLPANQYGQVDLQALLAALGEQQITSLLVEGGRTIHESFFQENLVNKTHVYLAPVIIAATEKKQSTQELQFSRLKNDLHITTYCKEN